MVRELRKGRGKNGLVLANGGVVTYEYVVCLSSKPRNSPFPDRNPLPEYVTDEPIPPVDEKAEGEAVIEVSFNTNYHHDLADCTDLYGRIQSRRYSVNGIYCRKVKEQQPSICSKSWR
jgi:hypothetical protein